MIKITNIFQIKDSPHAMDATEEEMENRVFMIEFMNRLYSLTISDTGLKLEAHGVEVFDKQGHNSGHTQVQTIFDLTHKDNE